MSFFRFLPLLASLLIHFVFIAGFFLPDFFFPKQTQPERKEVKQLEMLDPDLVIVKNPTVSRPKPELAALPYQENIFESLLQASSRQLFPEREGIAKKSNSFSLSQLPAQKKLQDTPAYMNYYRLVREKIRQKAYQSYNGQKQGDIFLNFTIRQDGSLEEVKFTGQSVNIRELKRIALSSLEKSAPFPPFPEELKSHPRLLFNVPIHFKRN